MERQRQPRTGDEPSHARSPLRMRLVLAFVGLANGLLGVGIFGFWLRTLPFLAVFAAITVIALVNIVVVIVRIRQGAHYQPGRDVPPYRPVEPEPHEPAPPTPITPRRRYQRYFLIMGLCMLLIVLAWTWVRFYSVLAAGIMSGVAALLPPLAAVMTNADSPILRDDDSAPPNGWFGDGPPPEWFDEPGGNSDENSGDGRPGGPSRD
jgi:hypothetical protein